MGVGKQLIEALRDKAKNKENNSSIRSYYSVSQEYAQNDNICELLEKMDAQNVNETDESGITSLHMACYMDNVAVARKLLSIPGINVNASANSSKSSSITPIMTAAANCSLRTLKLMLDDLRVDLDVRDEEGRALLDQVGRKATFKKTKNVPMAKKLLAEARRKRENSDPGHSREEMRTYTRQQYDEKINKNNIAIAEKEQKIRDNTVVRNTLEKEDRKDRQDLANLKELAKQLTNDRRKLDMDPDNDTSSKLEAARETLECPVCLTIMKPPLRIWMCSSSHLICEPCKARLEGRRCPTCRTERVTLRAFIAENFSRSLFDN